MSNKLNPKPKDENGKDPARNTPVDLPSVKPEQYSEEIEANKPALNK